jgi:Leucine-rich repeat (LRR) protein
MLNLAHNNISKIEGLSHLKNLAFLDLSFNQIDSVETSQLPSGLMILRLNKNPVENYREKLVVYLTDLVELDRVKVVQAERLWYRGLLPK